MLFCCGLTGFRQGDGQKPGVGEGVQPAFVAGLEPGCQDLQSRSAAVCLQ